MRAIRVRKSESGLYNRAIVECSVQWKDDAADAGCLLQMIHGGDDDGDHDEAMTSFFFAQHPLQPSCTGAIQINNTAVTKAKKPGTQTRSESFSPHGCLLWYSWMETVWHSHPSVRKQIASAKQIIVHASANR